MLFRTKVGFYTNQVFEKAVGQFEETYRHYSKIYENIDGLKYLFAEQLKKIMPRILEYK